MSFIDEVMERLGKGQAIKDMEAADDESLKRFEAFMRHYGGMARKELDARGVKPFQIIGAVEVFDRRHEE